MRALLPEPEDDVDVVAAYASPAPPPDRPFVRCNMISSIDGAVSVEGRSGLLGGPADRNLFRVLRSWADVVLVGAGTARTERYGPVRLDADLKRQREERGQSAVPPIAVVTMSAELGWDTPFFTEAESRPIVLTTSAGADRIRPGARRQADVVVSGDDRVDAAAALDNLYRRGYRSVLLEGGPTLNADLIRAGLLDEICLTLAPRLVAGHGPRLLAGEELGPPELPGPPRVETVQLLEEDGYLFLRLKVLPG